MENNICTKMINGLANEAARAAVGSKYGRDVSKVLAEVIEVVFSATGFEDRDCFKRCEQDADRDKMSIGFLDV